MNTTWMQSAVRAAGCVAVVLSGAVVLQGCMPYSTDSTEVGVRVVKWSPVGGAGIQDTVYPPGVTQFFPAFLNDWYTFDTRLQSFEMTATPNRNEAGVDDLVFKTIDGNDISLDVTITWQIQPEKAPMILREVATSNEELKDHVVRTIARSMPRDLFGELNTEEFYISDERAAKSEEVTKKLNETLEPYGVVVQRVSTKGYRFNEAYQKAIEDKKIADQEVEKLKSETEAVKQEYLTKVEEAKAQVEKMEAEATGEYERAKIEADAYYEQQVSLAKAIEAEGRAEAEGISKMNEALAGSGGPAVVKLAIAEALMGKRIVMVPSGDGGLDVRTTDVNDFLKQYGAFSLGNGAKAKAAAPVAPAE